MSTEDDDEINELLLLLEPYMNAARRKYCGVRQCRHVVSEPVRVGLVTWEVSNRGPAMP